MCGCVGVGVWVCWQSEEEKKTRNQRNNKDKRQATDIIKIQTKKDKERQEECTLFKAACSLRRHQFMMMSNVNTESTNETPLSIN